MSTLIWAGLRSMPEVVNYKFVVFVFRSLIICPNFPLKVLDYYSYSLLRLYSYSRRRSSNIFYSSFIFYKVHFFLYYSYFIFLSFSSIWRCYLSFYSFILLISNTLFVLGSITSYTFFGLGWVWSIIQGI